MEKKILIIEDDEDIRNSFQELLETEGYSVETACNGKVALEQLKGSLSLPSLILLDLMMPVMDGFQFRAQQETDPRLSTVPIVIMTADGHIESKQMRIGAAGFLKKPSDVDVVLNIVALHSNFPEQQ